MVGGGAGSGIPMAMHDTIKPEKEVKVRKKQSKKEKAANYDRKGEERSSTVLKKPPPPRRNKSGVGGSGGGGRSKCISQAPHAVDKIQSLDGLFSE